LSGSVYGVDCYTTTSRDCVKYSPVKISPSIEDFLKTRDKIGKDPHGGAALFISALLVRSENKTLGDQLVVLAMAEENLIKRDSGGTYKGYSVQNDFLLKQADKVPQCIRSYDSTTSVKNNYTMASSSLNLIFRNQTKYVGSIESGTYKIFVCSTGADTCRPVTLVKNKKGFWKVKEYSSIVLGCKNPPSSFQDKAADEL